MIFIALYWLFLFILLLPFGIIAKHALHITAQNTILTLLLGIVLLTCGFTLTAIFFPLGAINLAAWTILSFASGIYYRKEIKQTLAHFSNNIKQLPLYLKTVVGILIFGALLKSAQFPFITDNESYYIQTIKWLNEYGFVKGLANLHVFFAQNSAWHILQAGLNFSFITGSINDINGFVFIICTIYCITEGYALSNGKKIYWLAFMPAFALLLFLFLEAPSPDLPLLVIIPILLHLYIQQDNDGNNYKIALLLFIYLVSIKITVLPLGLVFLPRLFSKKNLSFLVITALPIGILWIIKNTIVSGYPLYPLPFFKTGYNWAIPDNLFHLIIEATTDYGYNRNGVPLPHNITMAARLMYWIQQTGLARIMNVATLAVLAIMPFSMLKNKKYRFIYIALLVNFLFILFTSPQFRYFLYITLSGSLFVVAAIYNKLKVNLVAYKMVVITGSLLVVVSFLNFGLSKLTTNKLHQKKGNVQLTQVYMPETNTKFPDIEFEKIRLGNLEYYSPKYNFFRFGTANAPLPAVNRIQIKYFKRKLGIVPQLRTNDIKDGFKSVKDTSL